MRNGYLRLVKAAFVLIVLAGFTPSARAATLHVPTQFSTIQAAINAASDGDTIEISPGTYVENLFIGSKGVALVSTDNAAVTTVSAAIRGPVVETRNYVTPTATTLRGLTITGGLNEIGGGLSAFGHSPIVVTDCLFDNNHSVYGYFGAAIAAWNPPLIVERCRFTNNDQQGDTQFFAGVITVVNGSTATIRNNVFWHNNTRAINLFTATAPTIIENNTMVDNRAGLYLNGGIQNPGIAIRNNIIASSLYATESSFSNPYTLTTFQNNLVFGNTIDFFNALVSPLGVDGNISVAPLFVNEPGGDFHLAPGSPAIDAGTAIGAPLDDIENRMRPLDGNGDGVFLFDIGAYEAPTVELFNLCIQDDSSGSILRINSTTGDYQFTNCSGFTLDGIGALIIRGGVITLQHYGLDRRVLVRIDTTVNKATATIQLLSPNKAFTITDRNTTNNTCACNGS